jgi:hypothetical protein
MWRVIIGLLITLTLGICGMPHVPHAQPPGKVYRIGWLSEGARPDGAYLEALRALGYVEGHNLVVEHRYAKQEADLPALAAELVTRQVDLLMTFSTASHAGGPTGDRDYSYRLSSRHRSRAERACRQLRPAGREPHGGGLWSLS